MAKKTGPYVGVTGFMSRAEVTEALTMVPEGSARRLMVGVLMSSKTLAGQMNKWPGRYPKKEAVADIFIDDPRALNLIHYNTDNPNNLCAELRQIVELAGPHLDGFQLNVKWPSPSQIQLFREAFPDMYLLLQIGAGAMAETTSIEAFEEALGWYIPEIDAILIDPSGGKGEPFDAAKGMEYLRAARNHVTLELGIAGGLGPYTLHLLDPIVREFRHLSIDAEGQLRTPKPEDALCIGAMRTYLEDAFPILAGKELPGLKLVRGASAPYGFEGHIRNHGLGVNMWRTPRLAQHCALIVGDLLATGDRVLSPPREGGNGSVLLHLTGGFDGHWVGVPARIPIALLTKEDDAPAELWNMS